MTTRRDITMSHIDMSELEEIKRRAGIAESSDEEDYTADPQELVMLLLKRIDDLEMSDKQFRDHVRNVISAFVPPGA